MFRILVEHPLFYFPLKRKITKKLCQIPRSSGTDRAFCMIDESNLLHMSWATTLFVNQEDCRNLTQVRQSSRFPFLYGLCMDIFFGTGNSGRDTKTG